MANELSLNVQQSPGTIHVNFDELERALDEKLSEYKGAVFTEDSKGAAKGELASLRKLKSDLNEAKKGVKNEWMKPYMQFESRVKALMSKVDEPINLIDAQVKEFDQMQKEAKRKKVQEIYSELVTEDIMPYMPLESIYDKRWENINTTLKSIKAAIQESVDKVRSDVHLIQTSSSDVKNEALSLYQRTHDLTVAINHMNQYEQNKARALEIERERQAKEEERKRQAEIDRIRAEERERIAREEELKRQALAEAEAVAAEAPGSKQEPDEGFVVPEIEDDDLPFVQSNTKTAYYRIVGTDEEIDAVETAFNSIGIFFERRDA